jgi:hypothetical protein
MSPSRDENYAYFPMVWGVDLVATTLNDRDFVVIGKLPRVSEDFQSGRDPYAEYLPSVKTQFAQRAIHQPSPHVRFANATTDGDLLDFIEDFGPIAPKEVVRSKADEREEVGAESIGATQEIECLRRERTVYAAAISLMDELRRGEKRSSASAIRKHIAHILEGVKSWPDQFEYEKQWRETNCPSAMPWHFDLGRFDRLRTLKVYADSDNADSSADYDHDAKLKKALLMNARHAGQMFLSELINSFAVQIGYFNNKPLETLPVNSVSFGIRPCLYFMLRREILSKDGVGVCRNDRCRRFFTIGRGGQVFCDPDCSMKYRQRKNWAERGSKRRKARRRRERQMSRKG